MKKLFALFFLLNTGCQGSSDNLDNTNTEQFDEKAYLVDAWADNWFAFYVDGVLVAEDSASITTERSFNKESFSFDADPPFQIAVIIKDYKENDSGLEYIGESNQQMGDGGFIAQIFKNNDLVLGSGSNWRCLPIHQAPLNPSCESSDLPNLNCLSEISSEPDGWQFLDFDDSSWLTASEYTENEVSPKDGYDEVDNTILCRIQVYLN